MIELFEVLESGKMRESYLMLAAYLNIKPSLLQQWVEVRVQRTLVISGFERKGQREELPIFSPSENQDEELATVRLLAVEKSGDKGFSIVLTKGEAEELPLWRPVLRGPHDGQSMSVLKMTIYHGMLP